MEPSPKFKDDAKTPPSRVADRLALVAAGALIILFTLFHGQELRHDGVHLIRDLVVTLSFAVLGRLSHGVSFSGAIAGAVVAFLMATRDLFWILLVVFSVTLVATRMGQLQKKQLRIAESDNGRSASQVIANLGIAALILALPSFGVWRILALAALAEASADTTSSEIGTAIPGRTVLISTWRPVSPGIDGGISMSGTIAGLFAATIIAASGVVLGLITISEATKVACAGTVGMLVDSLLGATLEKRGYLTNDLVNLFGTASAVLIAWLLMQ